MRICRVLPASHTIAMQVEKKAIGTIVDMITASIDVLPWFQV